MIVKCKDTKPVINICGRKIGIFERPIVIVEIGINHEGSLETAFKMVDAACDAGAEVIKHQTHVVEDEMSGDAKKIIPGNADISIYDIMERCALNEKDEIKLKEYEDKKKIHFNINERYVNIIKIQDFKNDFPFESDSS